MAGLDIGALLMDEISYDPLNGRVTVSGRDLICPPDLEVRGLLEVEDQLRCPDRSDSFDEIVIKVPHHRDLSIDPTRFGLTVDHVTMARFREDLLCGLGAAIEAAGGRARPANPERT
jgi:hypothetical protein